MNQNYKSWTKKALIERIDELEYRLSKKEKLVLDQYMVHLP